MLEDFFYKIGKNLHPLIKIKIRFIVWSINIAFTLGLL